MRPRFSLRWLLIAVTVVAVLLFVLLIHPDNKAQSFVNAVNDRTFDLNVEARLKEAGVELERLGRRVDAALIPRNWADRVFMRRRVKVTGSMANGDPGDPPYKAYKQTAEIGFYPVGKWVVVTGKQAIDYSHMTSF
jgi:hypothetical protein